MNSFNARWSPPSPNKISLERHSCLTDRTHRSANAFRFGLCGGSARGLAVALAAQKTIENLFGGISVIGDRPVLSLILVAEGFIKDDMAVASDQQDRSRQL